VLALAAAALGGGALGAGAADRPALGEAAAEGQSDVRLADGEGGRAHTDDDDGRDQDTDHDTEEAAEGEQPVAQPCLVLQQHLTQQP
jgi:hypothetical protein